MLDIKTNNHLTNGEADGRKPRLTSALGEQKELYG